MERAIDCLSDITYKSELIPPSCFRKKAGEINSPKQLTPPAASLCEAKRRGLIRTNNLCRSRLKSLLHKLCAH